MLYDLINGGPTLATIKYNGSKYALQVLDKTTGEMVDQGEYRELQVAEYAALVWYNNTYLEG